MAAVLDYLARPFSGTTPLVSPTKEAIRSLVQYYSWPTWMRGLSSATKRLIPTGYPTTSYGFLLQLAARSRCCTQSRIGEDGTCDCSTPNSPVQTSREVYRAISDKTILLLETMNESKSLISSHNFTDAELLSISVSNVMISSKFMQQAHSSESGDQTGPRSSGSSFREKMGRPGYPFAASPVTRKQDSSDRGPRCTPIGTTI